MKRVEKYICAAAAVVWLASCGGSSDESSVSLEDLKSNNVLLQIRAIEYAASSRAKSAVPDIVELLGSPFEDVRLASILALRDLGGGDAVPALVERLDDESLEVRRAAVTALGQMGMPEAVPYLTRFLVDDDLELAVIWALGNIGDSSSIPVLNRLQSSEDPYVRYNASKALARME